MSIGRVKRDLQGKANNLSNHDTYFGEISEKERPYQKCSTKLVFKGYLRYKTITSQNMSSEEQIKKFFIS